MASGITRRTTAALGLSLFGAPSAWAARSAALPYAWRNVKVGAGGVDHVRIDGVGRDALDTKVPGTRA